MAVYERRLGAGIASIAGPQEPSPHHSRRGGSLRIRLRPHWLPLALLLAVGLVGLRIGHMRSTTFAQMQSRVSPPKMPRRIGLAVANVDAWQTPLWTSKVHSFHEGLDQTLSFKVCGGFAQQRFALLSGIVLAAELNRTLVVPWLLREDASSNSTVLPVPFGDLYDDNYFVEHLRLLGVRVTTDPPKPADTFALQLAAQYEPIKALHLHSLKQHLRVDCPALALPPSLFVEHEHLVLDAMAALRPNKNLMNIINMFQGHLQGLSKTGSFNMLQLRAEDVWVEYCSRWGRPTADGLRVHDNCLNNTANVGERLHLHRIDPEVPLLVLTHLSESRGGLLQQALQSLQTNNYHIVPRDDVLLHNFNLASLCQDEIMLIDYYLGLSCHQYVGNSVSVFTALLIMERWHAGKFATYYNGGNIPLESYMPLYQMPWVFTYNDWSAGTEYDHMVKAAVTSAIEVARMKPFCMYSGSTTADMYQWLLSKGVTIIQHEPAWRDALVKEGARNKEANMVHSHLYRTGGTLVGTFQRIDIPILQQFDQYNYVLFTDCDVYFRQQMKLVDWGTPLPIAVGMGYEGRDVFPYNAGIMLFNMPYMRHTNQQFLDWILAQKNGLYFPGYGPLDQGAFNQFYEREIKDKPINKDFNAMLFHAYRPDARIVHMNGPKPNHYLEYLTTGKCAFGDLCNMGITLGGACMYMAEYQRIPVVQEWPVAAKLSRLCANLLAGIWHA